MPRTTYRPNRHMRTPFPTQSNQPAAVRARPQDRRVRRPAQSWPGHACQTRARVAWLMPSDRSEVRQHLLRRDHLTSPARDRRSRCAPSPEPLFR
eukprot:scaffold14767_cov36-Phaeocystis_antarctica.AAC.1